jgi:hypothetical protein
MPNFAWTKITFTHDEWAIVDKPIECERAGGHQLFLREVLQRTDRETLSVNLSPSHLETLRKYNKGSGGYQTRLACIQAAVDRAKAA